MQQGNLDEAEAQIRESIRLLRVPTGYTGYHLALGAVHVGKG
jgi:hypothetical protein